MYAAKPVRATASTSRSRSIACRDRRPRSARWPYKRTSSWRVYDELSPFSLPCAHVVHPLPLRRRPPPARHRPECTTVPLSPRSLSPCAPTILLILSTCVLIECVFRSDEIVPSIGKYGALCTPQTGVGWVVEVSRYRATTRSMLALVRVSCICSWLTLSIQGDDTEHVRMGGVSVHMLVCLL